MDKVQAETVADALLRQERIGRRREDHQAGWGSRTRKERGLLAVFTVVGAAVGLGVFYFTAQRVNDGALLTGAELGAGMGILAGRVAMLCRRALAIRSTGR